MTLFAPRKLAAVLAAILLLFAATGCPADPEPVEIDPDQDAGIDDVDDNDVDDTDVDDNDEDPIDPAQCHSGDVVEPGDPEQIDVDEWLVGAPEGDDLVSEAFLHGDFEIPAPGTTEYGTEWRVTFPEEDGAIPSQGVPSGNTIYAATNVEVHEDTVAFARADDIATVYINGLQQPGDIYGAGDKRVPIPLSEGENELVVRYTMRHSPQLELFDTPDEVYFNTEDITDPDLRVGTDRTEQLGIHVLNLSSLAMTEVEARVVENDYFEESVVQHPALGPDASTQLAFELEPKNEWDQPDEEIPVVLQLESCQTADTYEIELTLDTVAEDDTFNRTYREHIDNSVQYYGVVPPKDFDEDKDYGLAHSMHGASVEAASQARNYAPKETMYVIAPTNRRPFGFDWEEWGRLNSLASLDHARETFNIDDTRTYATGHSMGGHGTWHLSVLHPGRFAALGPSAGWSTFYSYSGAQEPGELIEPARAHSDTYRYMSNLRRRGAYILHGDADTNVPLSEGEDLYEAISEYTDDIIFHIEPGKDHWWGFDQDQVDDMGWNYDADTRQECLDWLPMFEFFKQRELDLYELAFDFRTPGQWIGADHSYVSLESTQNPFDDAVFISKPVIDEDDLCEEDEEWDYFHEVCVVGDDEEDCDEGEVWNPISEECVDDPSDDNDDNDDNGDNGDNNGDDFAPYADVDAVELTTENVRAFDVDAAALLNRGVEELIIDGDIYMLADEDDVIEIGPRDGKNRDVPGLLNPTFHKPFCFVYPDDDAEVYRGYAAYLLSTWSLNGNGHGCALPLELLTDEIAEERNLIYLGVDLEEIPDYEDRPFEWDDTTIRVGDLETDSGAGFVTFPDGDRQSAAFIAIEGDEHQVFFHQPFSSRAGMPDFLFVDDFALTAGGYFDAEWDYHDGLAGGN